MDKAKRNKIILFAIISALFITLFALASVYDFQISSKLADLKEGQYFSDNIFGRVFETVGEMPIYLFTAFACTVFAYNCLKIGNKAVKYLLHVLFTILSFGLLFAGSYKLFGYISDFTGGFTQKTGWCIAVEVILACSVAASLYFSVMKISEGNRGKLLLFSVVIALTAIFSQIIVQGIKMIWARPRFRTLNYIDDFDKYIGWFNLKSKSFYKPLKAEYSLISDAFKSFPSGHTCAASLSVTLCFIPWLFSELKPSGKIIIYAAAVIYPIIVAISRIVMGAHYLSDVLFGGGVTVLFYLIFSFLTKRYFSKFFKKSANSPNSIDK